DGLRTRLEEFLAVGFSKLVPVPLGAPPGSWDEELETLAGAVLALPNCATVTSAARTQRSAARPLPEIRTRGGVRRPDRSTGPAPRAPQRATGAPRASRATTRATTCNRNRGAA